MSNRKSFDVFISHASEDKDAFVEPLAVELRRRRLEVWFDKFELKVGSSLRESIELGLAKSQYGIVVFSPSFFAKKWPKKELNGLFSREMSGNKVRILPILHNIKISEITKRYPIQSDRFSLLSSAPLGEICDKLVEVIRPALANVNGLKNRTFEVSEAFVAAARKNYPGYGFSVSSSSSNTPGTPNGRKIEIRIDDPTAITEPPIINVQFIGEGARKANEFIRTGKPQKWITGEFVSIKSAIPFFTEMTEGEFSVGGPSDAIAFPVSVRCGSTTLPYMLRKLVRCGTEEAEFEISSNADPLKFAVVWSPSKKTKTLDITFSWSIQGFSAKRVLGMLDFIDEVSKGSEIVISDLQGETQPLILPIQKLKKFVNPFDEGSKKLIQLCAQIEDTFKVKLPMTMSTTDDDRQSLVILNSLLNDTDIGVKITKTIAIEKGNNPSADKAILSPDGMKYSLFAPVEKYQGFLPVFGIEVKTPLWGVWSEALLNITSEEIENYRSAVDGTEIILKLSNEGRGKYRWASDFPTLDGGANSPKKGKKKT